jgi:NADPH:quinone reductase
VRIVRYHSYGDPSVLQLDDVPVPRPGEGEVLVRVGAAGVTLPAVRQVRGGDPAALPAAVGGEVAGVVTAVGPSVTGIAPDDRVTGLSFSGAYAPYAIVPAALATRVPAGVPDTLAVAVLRSGQVAAGVLAAGDPAVPAGASVLVTAAASGVGHLLVQLARLAGYPTVIGAVGSERKLDFVRSLGVSEAVTYSSLPSGVDVVLDGAGLLGKALACLRPGGRMVFFASGGGELPAWDLLAGGLTVTGFSMARFARTFPEAYAAQSARLWELAQTGTLRVAVDSTYPLVSAADAHRRVEARANRGKVVILPGE